MRILSKKLLVIGLGLTVYGTSAAQDSGAAVTPEPSMVKEAMEAAGKVIKKAADGT